MRRLALILSACVLLAGIVGPVAPGETDAHRLVIRLISDNRIVSSVDKSPKGASVGDRVVTTSTLRNQVAQFGKPKGVLVGHDRATEKLVTPTSFTIDGYAILPGGRILFRGRISSGAAPAVPVIGGTGRFAHARGTVFVEDTGGARSINVYQLRLP